MPTHLQISMELIILGKNNNKKRAFFIPLKATNDNTGKRFRNGLNFSFRN